MSEFVEYRIEIEPMKKEKFLAREYWELCAEEEAEGYGVYCNDDLEGTFETVGEAEKYLAERFARVAVENSLYHVHEYEDGENTSLLVVAKSPSDAVRFFDEHWRQNDLQPGESGQDILVHVVVDARRSVSREPTSRKRIATGFGPNRK